VTWDVTLAVLLAAVMHAGWNAAIKKGREPLFETTLVHAWVGMPALAMLPWLPLPGTTAALCLLVSVTIHCGYYHTLAAAYRSGDLSFAYPIMRGSAPMLTAIASGLVLAEWPPLLGWLGIAAISCGVFAIGIAASPGGGPAGGRSRTLGWALLTALTIVAYTIVDSIGARSAPNPWVYVAWLAAVEGPAVFAMVLAMHGAPLLVYGRERGVAPLWIGIVSTGGYGIVLWAMTRAPVALVAALRETSVLFALLIAAWILGERFGPMRWAAAVSIVGGVVALRLA
jgi:drug/metabolite transporter (DMT)-like permease